MKDCTDDGRLLIKYVILQRTFDHQISEEYFICSCGKDNCLHIEEISTLCPPYIDQIDDASEEFECEFLSDKLIGIYCKENNSYAIINHTKRQTKCLTCSSNVTNCIHVKALNNFNKNNDITNIRTQETFHSISKELIDYPFDDNYDIETFAGYASGEIRHNTHLVLEYNPYKRCVHANPFS